MKKIKTGPVGISLVVVFLAVLSISTAHAAGSLVNEVISLSAGEGQTREFILYEPFDIKSFQPGEGWIVIVSGDNETKPGKLTISMSTSTTIPFGALMSYTLAGFAFSPDGGPSIINETVTTPFKIKKAITINSTFGFAYVAALIRSITGDVPLPAKFAITFELAAAETAN